MRIERLGDGDPEVALVAAIHGDEPCGVRAIERLLAENPTVQRPVKLIIANERALEREVRFTDADLNRVLPGDPDSTDYERRLAYELRGELRDCLTFSMHSTQSYAGAFGIVDDLDERTRAVCSRLPIDAVVETGPFTDSRLISLPGVFEAECGEQGTDQAAGNAYELARAFLAATGALDSDTQSVAPRASLPVYRLERAVPKNDAQEYEVFVTNFERVAADTPFAAADGERLVADDPFYPVLMSTYGYENVFGYAASKVGTLDSPAASPTGSGSDPVGSR